MTTDIQQQQAALQQQLSGLEQAQTPDIGTLRDEARHGYGGQSREVVRTEWQEARTNRIEEADLMQRLNGLQVVGGNTNNTLFASIPGIQIGGPQVTQQPYQQPSLNQNAPGMS